ncbi:hypothetical protein ENHY17A_600001 [Moraxellaceae bacterium 17A]|nr:hypothetical protein ENHY17A_600001 [Moraxellaceae bacterium 17A]
MATNGRIDGLNTIVNSRFETLVTNVNTANKQMLERQTIIDEKQNVQISQNTTDIKNLGHRVNDLDKSLSGGIASSVAFAMMPTITEAGVKMVSMGTGYYNGQSAVSVGFTGTDESGKYSFKFGSSYSTAGDATFGAGVGFRWK